MEPASLIAFGSALGLSPAAGKLIERVFGPAADEAGGILRERISARRNRVVEKATRDLSDAKIEPREVPLRLLAPILEHAALEDEPTLSDKWAALLANAAAGAEGNQVTPRFTHILSMLTPEEARFLDYLALDQKTAGGKPVDDLANVPLIVSSLVTQGLMEKFSREVKPDGTIVTYVTGNKYQISLLGRSFLKACSPPGRALPTDFAEWKIELP